MQILCSNIDEFKTQTKNLNNQLRQESKKCENQMLIFFAHDSKLENALINFLKQKNLKVFHLDPNQKEIDFHFEFIDKRITNYVICEIKGHKDSSILK